jgi:acetyl esterase/lipase
VPEAEDILYLGLDQRWGQGQEFEEGAMSKKRYRPEENIAKLREADVLIGQRRKIADVIKEQDFPIGHLQMMANLLGGQPDEVPERYDPASPITHAGPKSPPTLLLQGEHDSLVPASAWRTLHHKLVQAGVPVVHVEFPQTEHAFDVAMLSRYSPAGQAALYELERFLALV